MTTQDQSRFTGSRRPSTDLEVQIESFLVDRKSRELSEGTLRFYRQKLKLLGHYLTEQGIHEVRAITADHLRGYLLKLRQAHNPGGVHAAFRTVRAFLRWWEAEDEPEDWSNPLRKVRGPKVPIAPLEPVSEAAINAMMDTCNTKSFVDTRDKAILWAWFDTGCRAAEFTAINLGDVDLATGQVLVRKGKGSKPRMVRLGDQSRKALRAYLRHLGDREDTAPLWVTRQRTRLTYSGLRDIVLRRADKAHVSNVSLHGFRRAFALNALRNGMNIFDLQLLMGHSDLTVLRRYLAQNSDDAMRAHEQFGPGDHLR